MKIPLAWFALLPCLLISLSVHSAMYKWVDKDGNTHYSDIQPFENAGEHISPTINTTPAINIPEPQITEESSNTKDTVYKFLKITYPANDETIRNNQGNFSIKLEIQPALNTSQGHYINILLDNKITHNKLTGLSAQFSNIDRGTHQISATIKNKRGKTILSSESIRIYLHRKSILNP